MNTVSLQASDDIDATVKMRNAHMYVACALAHGPIIGSDVLSRARNVLSREEWHRACRIPSPTRRTEHILGRALARRLLGVALGMDACDVPIEAVPGRKPRLRGTLPVSDFSVSHSGGCVLVGFTAHGHIGVDVEAGRSFCEPLARRTLDPEEFAQTAGSDADERTAAFLERWTAREARLKAIGIGLHAWGGRRRGADTHHDEEVDIRCESFALAPGVVGAVALRPRSGRNVPDRRVVRIVDEGWAVGA